MNDLAFVRRCTGGDKEAWHEFIEKYSRLIYSYIHSVLKVKGIGPAEVNVGDLFQDIFLCLTQDNFRKLKSFQGRNGCSLASWLRQVTVNKVIDYTRRVRPLISLDEEPEEGRALREILALDAEPAREIMHYQEKLDGLEECVSRLNKDDKLFLELHFNRRLNLEAVRRYFGISRGAVDMRKSRIVEKLKDCFRGKGFMLDF